MAKRVKEPIDLLFLDAEKVLAYLQSIKRVELKPVSFLKKAADPPAQKPE